MPSAPPLPGADVFLADGSETAVAVNVGDQGNMVAVFNPGYSNTPEMKTSTDGAQSWTTRGFPDGGGTFTGPPFDPWANAGNASGELLGTLIRRDTGSSNTHVLISRSIDAGATFSTFFELTQSVFQDREMVDVDRTTALGGGPGAAHDGKVYLTYDERQATNDAFVASHLVVVSPAGTELGDVVISTVANFHGDQLQPVAGAVDGQVYLMGTAIGNSGATIFLIFHEVTGAGTGATSLDKSTLSFPSVGQRLGTSTRFGVNGHRINAQMFMDIDRTDGPRRGYLFVVSDRNPNPGDPTRDQGDVYLSVSVDGALTWSSAVIPGQAPGKTQFFPMLDVDDNGWIHVAYYQNETGSADGGVLNASTANVYFTVSRDGGMTWEPPVRVNEDADTLVLEDPPPDRSADNFYLIGDYQQVKAAGTGDGTRAYVCWTGYDKNRGDVFIDDKRERVLCTPISLKEPVCGDGIVDPGEGCDDGNLVDGDCCSASCQVEAAGSACAADGDACTLDVCDGAGRCTHPSAPPCPACQICEPSAGCVFAPRTDCRPPRRAFLALANRSKDARDRLLYRWVPRDVPQAADFGTPLTSTDYSLCIYDNAGGGDRLLLERTAPAGGRCGRRPCWKAIKGNGFRYRDAAGAADGLTSIVLRGGAAGKARVTVAGAGARLGLPPLGLTPAVTAQLQAAGGACFAATYNTPSKNSASRFQATGE